MQRTHNIKTVHAQQARTVYNTRLTNVCYVYISCI